MTSDPLEIDRTREQLLATEGHLLIQGGPGCGKTTIALLRAKQEAATLLPEQQILFLSFSRAAVRQILDRTRAHLDADSARVLRVRTFHALFLDVIRAHAHLLNGQVAQIITPDEENRLKGALDGDWAIERTRLADEGHYVFDQFARVVADMVEKVPALRRLLSDRFPLIIVDEFQDTDAEQWRAVKALAAGSTIVALADPDQRIYEGFVPGVDEHRVQHLREALQPAEFDLSDSNFRSPGGGILDFGNALLRNRVMPVPEQVTVFTYPLNVGAERGAQFLTAWVRQQLVPVVGPAPSVAVLATSNAFLNGVSAAFSTPALIRQHQIPAIEHDLMWDPQLSSAAGFVVATVLAWPGQQAEAAATTTLDALVGYFQTKLGVLLGARGEKTAREHLRTATRAATRFRTVGRCQSKLGNAVVDAARASVPLTGNPVTDWRAAARALTGADELDDIAKRALSLPVMRADEELAWTLSGAWNGSQYVNPIGVLQSVLADDLLNGLGRPPSGTVLMTMHRSKGKEFDAVVIVEGRYSGQLMAWRDDIEQMRRRRLLRVAVTRARHRVVFVRPPDADPFFT